MLELPSLPNTFSPAAPSLWVSAEGYVNISIWSPRRCRGIYNWAVKQPRFEVWHAGSERLGTTGAGRRGGAEACGRFKLTWQGKRRLSLLQLLFFHLHSLRASLVLPLPRAVILG